VVAEDTLLAIRGLVIEATSYPPGEPPKDITLVHGVDLTLHRGRVLGLIGESGAGKSTIGLSAMAYGRGGLRLTGGTIHLNGRDIRLADAKALPTRLQHDYFQCYAGFYQNTLAEARGIAARYSDYPVARWRLLFGDVTRQLDEIEGKGVKEESGDKPDREKQQTGLAASEPGFDFKVENKTIALNYRNLAEVAVNYYLMDPEFSFSSNPFVSEDASRFSIIKPNKSATQALPNNKDTLDVPLPAEFAKANVLVEIVAAGQRKAQAYHANTLKLTLTENYGRLETRDSSNNRAVSKAYVKVYARLKNGTVRFFKDGYTDLRGRFDYASLNGAAPGQPVPPPQPLPLPRPGRAVAAPGGLDYQMLKPAELPEIDKFAILILSETNGAVTREVAPPSE